MIYVQLSSGRTPFIKFYFVISEASKVWFVCDSELPARGVIRQ